MTTNIRPVIFEYILWFLCRGIPHMVILRIIGVSQVVISNVLRRIPETSNLTQGYVDIN